jgi:hypothetical protein
MATDKYVLFNQEKVSVTLVQEWLDVEGKQGQEGLSTVRGVMERLLSESKVVGSANPTVTSVLGRVEMLRIFLGTVEDALLSIPSGLTPSELMEHPDVVKRRVARTKLRLGSFLRLERDPHTAHLVGLFGVESRQMDLIREMEGAIDRLRQLQSGLLALTSG